MFKLIFKLIGLISHFILFLMSVYHGLFQEEYARAAFEMGFATLLWIQNSDKSNELPK
jgi:hypothetical protein